LRIAARGADRALRHAEAAFDRVEFATGPKFWRPVRFSGLSTPRQAPRQALGTPVHQVKRSHPLNGA
jgi:hypothetical protein